MPREKQFSDDWLLGAVRDYAQRHGRPPRVEDLGPSREDGLPSAGTLARRFGSFAEAIERAGFPRPQRGRPSSQS